MTNISNHNISKDDFEQLLDSNPSRAADLLVEMAAARSGNMAFHKRAFLLKSSLSMALSDEERENIINKIRSFSTELRSLDFEGPSEKVLDERKKFFLEKGASKKIVIDCNDICKSYPDTGGGGFTLSGINLSLRLGEINGLVGENGNGKTTLLKIIAGELVPDSGSLTYFLDGSKIMKPNWPVIKKQIAYLPQDLPEITGNVIQNLRITAAVHGIRGMKNKLETEYIICRLGLESHINKSWRHLSGGYKLRFALARLLVRKPKVIVLDEPLANLDINTQNSLLTDLRDIGRSISNPVSIILSSQHLEEVESVADNMILLSAGKIRFNGLTSTIGNLRAENTFEIRTSLTKEELKEQLADFHYKEIMHTGFSFLINTSLQTSIHEFSQHLNEKEIPITYLCDISNSTRKMILKSNQQ